MTNNRALISRERLTGWLGRNDVRGQDDLLEAEGEERKRGMGTI